MNKKWVLAIMAGLVVSSCAWAVDLWFDVDAAITEAPVNLMPLIASADGITIDSDVDYNAAGLSLIWHFVTTAGVYSQTAMDPCNTGGVHDWVEQGNGMFTIEIPATDAGAADIWNDTEGYGWFTGVATGIMPWRGPIIGFRAAVKNNLEVDDGTAQANQSDFYDGTGYVGGTIKMAVGLDASTGTLSDAQVDDDAMGTQIEEDTFFTRIEAIVPTDFNSCTVDGNDALVATVGFFTDNGLDYFPSSATLVSSIWGAVARTLTAPTNITSDDSEILASSGALTVGTNNDKTGYALSVAGLASVTGGILADPTHPVYTDSSGYVGVGTMSTDVLTADALADAAATEIGSGVSTSLGDGSAFTALATASDQTAIKAKTDQLAFTDPNRVDASATVETSSINTIVAAIKKYLWKQ